MKPPQRIYEEQLALLAERRSWVETVALLLLACAPGMLVLLLALAINGAS